MSEDSSSESSSGSLSPRGSKDLDDVTLSRENRGGVDRSGLCWGCLCRGGENANEISGGVDRGSALIGTSGTSGSMTCCVTLT